MTRSTSTPAAIVRRASLALAAAAALGGCATAPNPKDPFESVNRVVFKFNDTVDQVALKPAATVYKEVLPSFLQTGIGNFFGNLADVWSAANNLMQRKGEAGMSDIMRVALNSTFGLFGVLDIASEAGLQKHNEDFGQTLGSWGVQAGPYLMLPLLGPSTVRDTAGLPLDIAADPWRYREPIYQRNIGIVTRVVDKRAYLLDATDLMEEAALDRYEFVRDGFLQQRESKVNDGESGPRNHKRPPRAAEDGEGSAPAVSSEVPAPELTAETPASAAL